MTKLSFFKYSKIYISLLKKYYLLQIPAQNSCVLLTFSPIYFMKKNNTEGKLEIIKEFTPIVCNLWPSAMQLLQQRRQIKKKVWNCMHELLIDTYFAIDKGQKGSCKKGQKGRQEAIFFYLAYTIFVVVGQRTRTQKFDPGGDQHQII